MFAATRGQGEKKRGQFDCLEATDPEIAHITNDNVKPVISCLLFRPNKIIVVFPVSRPTL